MRVRRGLELGDAGLVGTLPDSLGNLVGVTM